MSSVLECNLRFHRLKPALAKEIPMERRLISLAVSGLALVMLAGPAQAGVFGTLGNFDVVNDTGQTAHGFEIDLEGLHSADITDTFGGAGRGFPTTVERYGSPTITDYTLGSTFGVKVTYSGTFSSGLWNVGTPSGSYSTPGESCWTGGGSGYGPSTPCDHFGVGTVGNATKTSYSWLLESGTPGVLTPVSVNLPAPVWSVTPPANPAVVAPPVVVAHIQAPVAEIESQFGPAIWAKVYTTELENAVGLEELVGDNAKVKQAESHTEIEWQLLQTDPGNPLAGQLDNGDKAAVGAKAESVIRRYEFFNYAGAFDPETHEALVKSDSNPALGDVGSFIGAQNVAINLNGNVAVVPEPALPVLVMAGVVALVAVRRRRVRA
jgi:hypothetical protein